MTSVLKNVYTNKLDDIMDEHNNTYHKAIKILMLKITHTLIQRKKLITKILNLRLVIT